MKRSEELALCVCAVRWDMKFSAEKFADLLEDFEKAVRKEDCDKTKDALLGRLYVLLRKHRKTTTIVQANLYHFLEEEGFDLMKYKKNKFSYRK